jgi:uncharacterized protein
MEIKRNMVGWFEIPVYDMNRAMKFYEIIFDIQLSPLKMGSIEMAMFPTIDNLPGAQGALVFNTAFYKPSPTDGTLLYFTSQAADCAVELERVTAAGGKILQAKKLIAPNIGYMGLFLDTEGNRVAIHSLK